MRSKCLLILIGLMVLCVGLVSAQDTYLVGALIYHKDGEIIRMVILNDDLVLEDPLTDTFEPTAHDAHWSPDGTTIAFTAGNCQLHRMDAWGENIEPLAPASQCTFNPVWSPDSTRIAYLRASEPRGHISAWVMNADGTNTQMLHPEVAGCCVLWEDTDSVAFLPMSETGEGLVAHLDTKPIQMEPTTSVHPPSAIIEVPVLLPTWTEYTNVFASEVDPDSSYLALSVGGIIEAKSATTWTDVLFIYREDLSSLKYVIGGSYPRWQPRHVGDHS